MNGFLDYAVKYSCYYRVDDPKTIWVVDNDVRLKVLEMAQEKGYDYSTPLLHTAIDSET